MQNLFLSFGHSYKVWIDADTSSSPPIVPRNRNCKNRKTRNMTPFSSVHRFVFLSNVENDHVFFKLSARALIENHSQGIHEEEWYLCYLRNKLYAYGGIGSPILRKTDLFLFCVYPEIIKTMTVSAYFRS